MDCVSKYLYIRNRQRKMSTYTQHVKPFVLIWDGKVNQCWYILVLPLLVVLCLV